MRGQLTLAPQIIFPCAMAMTFYDNIPSELRDSGLWIRANGKKAIQTYATDEDKAAHMKPFALALASKKPKESLARLIDKSEGFVFVDLDKVRNAETGEIQEWAFQIIQQLATYTEVSASGTGFHLVARGTLPEDYQKDYPDPERPGHTKGVPVELKSGNVKNRLFTLTGDVYGIDDPAIQNRQQELEQLLQRCKAGEFGKPANAPTPGGDLQISGETFDNIKEKPLEWLWKNRIPKSKITIFGGNPDAGKSLVSLDLTARLTKGRDWPDGESNGIGVAEVALLFCEDDAADTVKPRLLAAGADCAKVHRLFSTFVSTDGNGKERQIAFDTDLHMLERFLLEHPAIRFLVIDPISNYLGEASMVKETDVRRVLVPLAELSARLEVTILLIAHLNKRSDVSALHKIMGAVAISGVARAAWMFAEDPENKDSYLMVRGKLNVGKKSEGLRYTITAKEIPGCGDNPFVKWNGTTDISAGQVFNLFGPVETGKGAKRRDAGTWLEDFLSAGRKPVDEILSAAEAQNISEKTLRRAKKELDLISKKYGECWYWELRKAKQDGQVEEEDGQRIF